MLDETEETLARLAHDQGRERARFFARQPKRITDLIGQVMVRKGYGKFESSQSLQESWKTAVGPVLAPLTRVGKVKRGVLEVIVANSVLMQELKFMQQQIIKRLAELEPEQKIRSLRFSAGSMR